MRNRGRKLHQDLISVYGHMILRVKAKLEAGDYVPDCLVKTLLHDQEKEGLDWEDLCMLAAVFTLGGVHSASIYFQGTHFLRLTKVLTALQTSGIIQWFLALIPSNPAIQIRAQEELDRVVGRDRLPTAEDEKNLPYIRAIIKEVRKPFSSCNTSYSNQIHIQVQRVHAPFWMATPHCTSEDFTYNGTFIPKDTVVVLNCYTLHHNEERYEDWFVKISDGAYRAKTISSWKFNPDRYLDDELSCAESAKQPDVMNRDHWTFGAGYA